METPTSDPRDQLIADLIKKNQELERRLAEKTVQSPSDGSAVPEINALLDRFKELFSEAMKLVELLGTMKQQTPMADAYMFNC
jgi:hypothetical protein